MASLILIFHIKFADMPEFCFIISLTMTLMTDCFVYDESRFTGSVTDISKMYIDNKYALFCKIVAYDQ